MKIALIGYMGSGKSAIANGLTNKLGLPKIDLDDYIEKKEKLKISEIFAQKGEIYFRKLETVCLLELLASPENFILSLGGGTPCFGNNMTLLNEQSTTVYLNASIATLDERLQKEKAKRPLIAHLTNDELPEFIAKHLFERNVFYRNAQLTVSVNQKSVDEIVHEIMVKLNRP